MGLKGWPYLLHSLLQNNNKSTDYTVMNYGVQDATIIPDIKGHSYNKDCRYEQLKKSMPHFVFLSFGTMDTHLKGYQEKQFIDSYVQMIKEIQSLPTRPMVFLMVPASNCLHPLNMEGQDKSKYSAFITDTNKCTPEQSSDQ